MLTELCVKAPAKINLGLQIFPKREDGFHNIQGIFQAIGLCDELHIKLLDEKNVCRVFCPSLVLPEKNTITSTYVACAELFGRDLPGVSVELTKRIPAGGGLGGGSSDGAFFLHGLMTLCKTKLSMDEADAIASEVGSDVFFFLRCLEDFTSAAVVRGRGEKVLPVRSRKDLHIVLVFPGVHSSTAEAYALVDKYRVGNESTDYLAVDELERVYNLSVGEWTFVNDFTKVICMKYPLVNKALNDIKLSGAMFADMSGSGATVFGVFESEEKARRAECKLSEMWQVCRCSTGEARAIGRVMYL